MSKWSRTTRPPLSHTTRPTSTPYHSPQSPEDSVFHLPRGPQSRILAKIETFTRAMAHYWVRYRAGVHLGRTHTQKGVAGLLLMVQTWGTRFLSMCWCFFPQAVGIYIAETISRDGGRFGAVIVDARIKTIHTGRCGAATRAQRAPGRADQDKSSSDKKSDDGGSARCVGWVWVTSAVNEGKLIFSRQRRLVMECTLSPNQQKPMPESPRLFRLFFLSCYANHFCDCSFMYKSPLRYALGGWALASHDTTPMRKGKLSRPSHLAP